MSRGHDGSEFELLSPSRLENTHNGKGLGNGEGTISPERLPSYQEDYQHANSQKRPRWEALIREVVNRPLPKGMVLHDTQELFYLALILVNILPIIVLAILAPTLSDYLGSLACLPNGRFVLPGNASVWDSSLFFSVSVAFGRNKHWTYTGVKVLDVAWDVIVGRGGQIVLIYISYRVFSMVLASVMKRCEIAYATYGAVAFEIGSIRSCLHLFGAVISHRFQTTFGGTFFLMAVAIAYVVSMPTLYSAMTGYSALSFPSVEIPPPRSVAFSSDYNCATEPNCTFTNCGGPGWYTHESGGVTVSDPQGGLLPGWGYCSDTRIFYPSVVLFHSPENLIREYYHSHESNYKAAAASTNPNCSGPHTNRSACPPLMKSSVFNYPPTPPIHLDPPLLDVQTWPDDPKLGHPNVWICSGLIINGPDFNDQKNVTGLCQGGADYQWGFSFLILFLVCILQFLWAAIMYGLWLFAHRDQQNTESDNGDGRGEHAQLFADAAARPTLIANAVAIVSQAESQYGEDLKTWSSKKLQKSVWSGRKGIGNSAPREAEEVRDRESTMRFKYTTRD